MKREMTTTTIFGTIGASLQTLAGGDITLLTDEVMQGVTEVLCYGTAVVVASN